MWCSKTLCLLAVVAIHVGAQAQECDLQIRDGSAARDLGRVLRCLDERLKKLEARSDVAETTQAVGSAGRNAAAFDAGAFTASVRVATRQDNSIRVAISLRNKTTEPVYVAERWHHNADQHVLVDESTGVAVKPRSNSVGLVTYDGTNAVRSFTQLPANAVLDFAFTFDGREVTGSTANLTLILYALQGGTAQRLTIPLAVKIRS